MRIGFDARMYSTQFTGIGRYNYELLKRLLSIDTKNEYIIFLNPQEYQKFDASKPHVKKVMVDAPHYSKAEQWGFLKALRAEKLDLMHFTHFNAPLLYRKPYVVTIHDLTITFYKGKKHTSLLKRIAYHTVLTNVLKHARHIIGVSEYTKQDILRLYPFTTGRVSMIYEGIGEEFQIIEDPARLEQTRDKYHLHKPFLLYTGNWRNHKNIEGLIRAFAIIVKNHTKDVELVITGKDNPYYPEVKELPKELGIADRVRLTGLVSDEELVDLYNLTDLYVFPSFYEGFGLPILESMSCGTPVASSNTSCLPEVGGEHGCVYFDPHNVSDMAQKILLALTDQPLREKLVQNGFQRIKDFSWDKMAEETLGVYQSQLS